MKPYYQESGITIYHGDCREIAIQLQPFDLCLTDPPYGLGIGHARNRGGHSAKVQKTGIFAGQARIAGPDYGPDSEWDNEPATAETVLQMAGCALESVIWGGNYFYLPPGRGWLVWDKVNDGTNFADAELAWTNIDMAVRIFRHMWNGMLRASERDVPRVHPTQKPIALMNWCLSFAPDAKTVIDPFMGSGSVLVAAKGRGLTATGIDREERYCEIAAKRLAQGVLNFEVTL